MSRIRLLPPDLSNQIAAGEVVERPASVVKELIENAIDAGARRIVIATGLGGKARIRVEDDGEGMEPEEARLSVERHATSKLASAADLAAIRTLGFRGEALPSIASVSHFTLRTRRRGHLSGCELRIDSGTLMASREVGAPEGTAVEVADLFYNLPARRKFLKSDAAESAQISRTVTQFALCYPAIGFTLTSGGRPAIQCAPVGTLRERCFQLLGERPDLVEVHKDAAGIRITGFAAALAEQGPVRGPQHVFVNGRAVRDRTIAHAILDAYSTATVKERSPEVHLFIELAPDRVDVNVHPAKAEVRFLEPSLIHEIVRRALAGALGTPAAPALHLRPSTSAAAPEEMARVLPGVFTPSLSIGSGQGEPRGPASLPPLAAGDVLPSQSAVERQIAVDRVKPMVPLGQFRDTYIIAIDSEGLLIIDQHVAHERVLFEQVLERLSRGSLDSQRLLEPLLLELPAGERQTLAERADTLERLGFDVSEFGAGTVRVGAVPALLRLGEASSALRALAGDLEGLDRHGGVEDALRRVAATLACHAAVKAHDPLTFEKMQYILDELRRTAYSTVCPHGRPIVLRITRREIEKNFQRI